METMTDPGTEEAPRNRARATCRYCGGDLLDATPESGYTGDGPDWAAWGNIAGTVVGFDWGCDGESNPDVRWNAEEEYWEAGSHRPDEDGIDWPATPWGPNSTPTEETYIVRWEYACDAFGASEALGMARDWLGGGGEPRIFRVIGDDGTEQETCA